MERNSKITEMVRTILEIFDECEINKIAYEAGFVKRSRKLPPVTFLAFCIFHSQEIYTGSLSILCDILKEEYSIIITENGLNKRFTETAVEFLRLFFIRLLNKQYKLKNKIALSSFDKVRIADATSFQVSSKYSKEYPWAGPKTKANQKEPFAAVRIQLEYDLLTGKILNINLDSKIYSDPMFLDIITPDTRKNELVIRDLGYFKLTDLQDVIERKAFFISKIKSISAIAVKSFMIDKDTRKLVPSGDQEYHKISMEHIVKDLLPGQTLELPNALIGSKDKLPCRLIITKLTDEKKGVREKKVEEDIKRNTLKRTQNTMTFSEITAYITNVPAEILPAEDVHDHYSLRWQIELVFKGWKSIFDIDKNKGMKIERFNCGLYGCISGIVLSTMIVNTIKSDCYFGENIIISEFKSYKLLKQRFNKLGASILKGIVQIKKVIKGLFRDIKAKCKKSKKKLKKLPENILKTTKSNEDKLPEKAS